MGMDYTIQGEWIKVNRNFTNSTDLAYAGTGNWATAGQNPTNWPDVGSAGAYDIPLEANGARFRFLVSNAADETVTATVWGQDSPNAGPLDMVTLTAIAGTSICDLDLEDGSALTGFFYADTLTITQNNAVATVVGTANGIAELRFDLVGMNEMYVDFALGTGADAIAYYKFY